MKNLKTKFLKQKRVNEGLSVTSINSYKSLFNNINNCDHLDLYNPSSFTLNNTFEFFRSKSKNWTATTYNFYRKLYIVFIKYLILEYEIENFLKFFPQKKEAKKLPQGFTDKQIARILRPLIDAERDVVLFFLYTGIRRHEFLFLIKKDIGENIRIKKGKGGKERILPMHDNLPSLDFPFDQAQLLSLYYKIKGKNKKFKWHRLRHTFATKLIQSGVDIYTISQLLGHSNINTTTIYLSLDLRDKEKKLNIINFNL